MLIQDLDQIPDDAIDMSQFLALDDPSQTFKVTLLQLVDALVAQRLNALFVKKSGDEMTGPLTLKPAGAHSLLINPIAGEVGLNAYNAAGVRLGKVSFDANGDYVFNQTDAAGGITGTVMKVYNKDLRVGLQGPFSLGAQGTTADALTRKDYVDTALNGKLGNSGAQTINGTLYINGAVPEINFHETESGKKWKWLADANEVRFHADGYSGPAVWTANAAGSMSIRDPHTITAQGTAAGALTRKDYVDAQKARSAGNGSGATSVTFNATGAKMACVTLSHAGRTYPLTFQLNGNTTWWLKERGGENADRDYDIGVSVVLNGASSTLTAVQGANSPGLPVLWEVHVW